MASVVRPGHYLKTEIFGAHVYNLYLFLGMIKKTALVLQGSGALAAYQYGVVKALYEKTDFVPDVVTGVSMGAVNAAVMLGARDNPVRDLDRLWSKLKTQPIPFYPQNWQTRLAKFGNPNMYVINPEYLFSPLTARSIYDLGPFYELLGKLIDFDRLNNHACHFIIEAVCVETGELRRFHNHAEAGITLEKIMASISLPPNFPMVKVGNRYYWDGGLYANLPLAPAINYLEKIDDSGEVERELFAVSLFRKNAVLPETLAEISDRIKEIIFESKLLLDQRFFERTSEEIDFIQQLDRLLPADSALRRMPAYQRLVSRRKIDRAYFLNYHAEGVEGLDDFTPASVDRRVRTGYGDTLEALARYPQRTQP